MSAVASMAVMPTADAYVHMSAVERMADMPGADAAE
jgi:hypothetical protein